MDDCVFCKISAGQEPAKYRYIDDEIMVIVNRLNWVPVMLLVIPRIHQTQIELWSNPLMAKMSDIAVDFGCMYCPNGFRILSNFGKHGMQSQNHAHLHVIGGTDLGPYA
jgi:histidine triad (HIT) family protein